MLPLSGLPPNAAVLRSDETLQFRLQQRFTAQVIQIATDHVMLQVDGVPVVARLTDPSQAAQLAARRMGQFVVKDNGPNGLVLQLLTPQQGGPSTPAALADNLITALLRQANAPTDDASAQIARALIARGLPVTADLINELQNALSGLENWGPNDAQLAAALKAAGLPLNAETLRLAREQLAASPMGDSLAQLSAKLGALAQKALPGGLNDLAHKALSLLENLRVDWSQSPADMAAQLHTSLATLGRAPEHDLAANAAAPDGLLLLAQLRGELAKTMPQAARDVIAQLDHFLDAARFNQLTNVTPHPVPPEGQLLTLPVPLRHGALPDAPAQLRVACRQQGQTTPPTQALTRLILQLDVDNGQTVEVDLAVVGRQIGATVTATSDELRATAEAELPAFGEGLQALGFALKTARCQTGWPRPAPTLADPTDPMALVAETNLKAARPWNHRAINLEA